MLLCGRKDMGCVRRKGGETMRSVEELLRDNRLAVPDDIDALLELAEVTRQAIRDGRHGDIGLLVDYAVRRGFLEALSWVLAAVQEEFDKADGCGPGEFTCLIGGSIPDYDGLIARLQVDLRPVGHGVEPVIDPNGEVQSFFNILTYRTAYRSVFLVSEENFDTKDNDFIRYRLKFTNAQPMNQG